MNTEAHAAIRDSFRKALPEILEGRDPHLALHDTRLGPEADCLNILEVVCEVSGVTEDEMRGRRRERRISRPRQIVYALIHKRQPMMMDAEIARFMGRHQTSIAHGIRQIIVFMELEPETRRIYHEAKRRLAR